MSKRSRWKPFTALAAVLGVGIVAAYLLVCKAQERRDFVGKVDPISGYRCRFTLSSSWRKYEGPSHNDVEELDEDVSFCPPPPNPMMSWISLHLFHKALSPGDSPTIAFMRFRPSAPMFHVREGYPEPVWTNSSAPDITLRRLRIDGFPATVATETFPDVCATCFTVYVPRCPDVYVVTACDTPAERGRSDHEIQAIISSFHIEKVAAPMRGKR